MRWITRSFRNLLITALIALVVLLGFPTFIYVTVTHTNQLVEERGNMISYLADTAAIIISENLRERSREVQLLAQSTLYSGASPDKAQLSASLMRMQETYPYYSWIGLTDMNGVVQVATNGLLEGQSVAQRPWFQQAQNGMYVGDLHEAKLLATLVPAPDGNPGLLRFIDFAAQVSDPQGRPIGVLGVHAHWGWSRDLIKLVTPPEAQQEGVEIFIVDQDNKIIFPDSPHSSSDTRRVPDIATGSAAQYRKWGTESEYLTAAAAVQSPVSTIPLQWRVLVRQPKESVLLHATELQQAITLVLGLALLGFVVLAVFLGRYFGRPVQQLTRTAQAIAQGRPAQFDEKIQTAELRRLNQALKNMSTRLLANQQQLQQAARELERKVAERTQELAQANKQLAEQARTDALTGLPNRLAADEFLAHEFSLLDRRPMPYAVLLIDADYFKRVNDQFGHDVGDAVLRHIGSTLVASVRSNDFLGRLGGEEFIAILPMTNLQDALVVAQKLRAAIEANPVQPVGSMTVSIGVAIASSTDGSPDDAVKRADIMLYEAKGAGRNCVMPGDHA